MNAVDIRQSDLLTAEEFNYLFGWGDDIFETAHLGITWRPKDLHFFVDEDERMASHAALLRHDISVDGETVSVAGLGGVVTLPWAQRRGHAAALVAYATNIARGWKVDGGLLFCIPKRVPYYEKLGWNLVSVPVIIQQPGGPIASPLPVMVTPFTERLRPIERIELNSLPW